MLRGEDYWPRSVTEDLEPVEVDGRRWLGYRGAPVSLYDAVRKAAERHRDDIAVVDETGESLTYAALMECVTAAAAALARHGIGRGRRLGCLMDNSADFIVVFLAAGACGAVFCPLPGKFRRQEVVPLATRARLDLLVCETGKAEDLRAALGGVKVVTPDVLLEQGDEDGEVRTGVPGDPESTAILMFTSGTTARAKAVLLSNRAVMHAVTSYERLLSVTDRDRSIIAVPMYHITGLVAIIGLMLSVGGRLYIHRRLRPAPCLDTLAGERITFIHASPTVFAMLADNRHRQPSLPSVRMLACGAAHMPVSLIRVLHDWMPDMEFRTVYGLTETTSPGTVFPDDAAVSPRIGSSGVPIPGLRVKIVDEEGSEVLWGKRGEICLSGTNLLTRYESESPETGLSGDGWLRTGDIGYVTPDGYLYVVDRLKHMINRGGEKVWCTDVEETIRSVEGVRDCCVVGVRDAAYGEAPAALVVRRPGASLTSSSLRASLREMLAAYEMPTRVLFVDRLPQTAGMKIDKRRARALLSAMI